MKLLSAVVAVALIAVMAQPVHAAAIKVASAGAFRQVLTALTPQFEQASGATLAVKFQTVGQHVAAIRNGEEDFDVAILTHAALADLARAGKIVRGSGVDLAEVGVGVVVKAGSPLPDIATVAAFKRDLLAAKSVAYIDPKAGGSSGIYVAQLLERLGIADQVNAKAKLIHGGAVATHIANGEAELGIHQISEILPVPGVVLVGSLPAEIQNFTVYAAGVSAGAANVVAANDLVKFLASAAAIATIKAKGMTPLAR